mmetsp:Transcript_9728/g.29481  ORF Transcript_9728/g.29481 Transcript_9728/m.29481 type:complete len:234 (-) Transcript_9728:686-1387(-)
MLAAASCLPTMIKTALELVESTSSTMLCGEVQPLSLTSRWGDETCQPRRRLICASMCSFGATTRVLVHPCSWRAAVTAASPVSRHGCRPSISRAAASYSRCPTSLVPPYARSVASSRSPPAPKLLVCCSGAYGARPHGPSVAEYGGRCGPPGGGARARLVPGRLAPRSAPFSGMRRCLDATSLVPSEPGTSRTPSSGPGFKSDWSRCGGDQLPLTPTSASTGRSITCDSRASV